MASKKNRKLSGVVLTGALVAPAVMSAAQQNVASADFLSSLKSWGSWARNVAMKGINAAWSTTYGKIGLCALATVGILSLGYLILDKVIPDDDKLDDDKLDDEHYLKSLKKVKEYLESDIDSPISLLFSQGDSSKPLRAVKIEKEDFKKAFKESLKNSTTNYGKESGALNSEKFENQLLDALFKEEKDKSIKIENFKGFLVPYKIEDYPQTKKISEKRLAENLNKIQKYLDSEKEEDITLYYSGGNKTLTPEKIDKKTFGKAFKETMDKYSKKGKEGNEFDFKKNGFKKDFLKKLKKDTSGVLKGVGIPNDNEKKVKVLDYCSLPE